MARKLTTKLTFKLHHTLHQLVQSQMVAAHQGARKVFSRRGSETSAVSGISTLRENPILTWFVFGFFLGLLATYMAFNNVTSLISTGQASRHASSMKWYEQEVIHNTICRPSPVNRLSRPQSCMGFETSLTRFALFSIGSAGTNAAAAPFVFSTNS